MLRKTQMRMEMRLTFTHIIEDDESANENEVEFVEDE
jgi:hypothetical protein